MLSTYEYAYVRVMPRVEQGEFLNVGVILFCRTRRFLATRIHLDAQKLMLLAPTLDLPPCRRSLTYFPASALAKGQSVNSAKPKPSTGSSPHTAPSFRPRPSTPGCARTPPRR